MVERRHARRTKFDGPMTIRGAESRSEEPIIAHVRNVSLAGAYCAVTSPCTLKPQDEVVCSLETPPEQLRAFPFSRLHGRGWIVRIERISLGRRAGESLSDDQLGLVVAFSPDLTALSSIAY